MMMMMMMMMMMILKYLQRTKLLLLHYIRRCDREIDYNCYNACNACKVVRLFCDLQLHCSIRRYLHFVHL